MGYCDGCHFYHSEAAYCAAAEVLRLTRERDAAERRGYERGVEAAVEEITAWRVRQPDAAQAASAPLAVAVCRLLDEGQQPGKERLFKALEPVYEVQPSSNTHAVGGLGDAGGPELRRLAERYSDMRDDLAYRKLRGDSLSAREHLVLGVLNQITRLVMRPPTPISDDVLEAAAEIRLLDAKPRYVSWTLSGAADAARRSRYATRGVMAWDEERSLLDRALERESAMERSAADVIARLTRERDEALAEAERLRAGLRKAADHPHWAEAREMLYALLASAETEATEDVA